jgi:hypothetical protein
MATTITPTQEVPIDVTLFKTDGNNPLPDKWEFFNSKIYVKWRNDMENQPNSILWMAEELDFLLPEGGTQGELLAATEHFLNMVAARGLRHCLYPA